jgi:hypothetical protein
MSIVRLLAFETLACGCVAGHYRESGSQRKVTYIEEKASICAVPTHRRNHAVLVRPPGPRAAPAAAAVFRHP